MTDFDYYFHHCWIGGWREIANTFRIWRDLMTGNYADYALLKEDNPYEECLGWFWGSLGEDETLPKAFIEHLEQMIQDINDGKVKTYPIDEVIARVKEEL
tara:strand:- start:309 stop:608 length:300 start_codon:yes stop_codon:yes gene_type:complete